MSRLKPYTVKVQGHAEFEVIPLAENSQDDGAHWTLSNDPGALKFGTKKDVERYFVQKFGEERVQIN